MDRLPVEIILDIVKNHGLSSIEISNFALTTKWVYNVVLINKERIALILLRRYYRNHLPGIEQFSLDFYESIGNCHLFQMRLTPFEQYRTFMRNHHAGETMRRMIKLPLPPPFDLFNPPQIDLFNHYKIPTSDLNPNFNHTSWIHKCIIEERIPFIEWYFNKFIPWYYQQSQKADLMYIINGYARQALRHNKVNILTWLNNNHHLGWNSVSIDDASSIPTIDIEILEWLKKYQYIGCTANAMNRAAANGRVDVLEWLKENTNDGCTVEAMNSAIRYGNLVIVRWLNENRPPGYSFCSPRMLEVAVKDKYLDIIRYLVDHMPEDIFRYTLGVSVNLAIEDDDADILKILLDYYKKVKAKKAYYNKIRYLHARIDEKKIKCGPLISSELLRFK